MPAPHPRMHGLTHARGGPDPIPSVATGGGAFFTAEAYDSDAESGNYPLLFPDVAYGAFYTSDPAVFQISSGFKPEILQPGGYWIEVTAEMGGLVSDPGFGVFEVLELYGVDAASQTIYGIGGNRTPAGGIISDETMPGAGGFAPAVKYTTFFNLADDYDYTGSRPVIWPFTLTGRLAIVSAEPHTLVYSIIGMSA